MYTHSLLNWLKGENQVWREAAKAVFRKGYQNPVKWLAFPNVGTCTQYGTYSILCTSKLLLQLQITLQVRLHCYMWIVNWIVVDLTPRSVVNITTLQYCVHLLPWLDLSIWTNIMNDIFLGTNRSFCFPTLYITKRKKIPRFGLLCPPTRHTNSVASFLGCPPEAVNWNTSAWCLLLQI